MNLKSKNVLSLKEGGEEVGVWLNRVESEVPKTFKFFMKRSNSGGGGVIGGDGDVLSLKVP